MEQSLDQYLLTKFNVVLLPTHQFTAIKTVDQMIQKTPIEEVSFGDIITKFSFCSVRLPWTHQQAK